MDAVESPAQQQQSVYDIAFGLLIGAESVLLFSNH